MTGGDTAAIKKFELIAEAYEVLTGKCNWDRSSLIKERSDASPEDTIFKDDKEYWKWWKDTYGDYF